MSENLKRAIALLRREKPEQPVRFCPRCGDSFTVGGARTIFRGDLGCGTRMQSATAEEAARALEEKT
jgi:tRNA(Ile2) C34 agmatinyltransferase TiaS